MEIEITKTENGYHCKDKDDGEHCFESINALLQHLKQFMPKEYGKEVKLTD